jgi:hypothetical protein
MPSHRVKMKTLLSFLALAVALGCASTPPARDTGAPPAAAAAHAARWGILVSPGTEPAIYSTAQWPPGTKLRAQRIDPMAESIEVTVGAASRAPDSPLYPDEGKESVQRYAVAAPESTPAGTLWICVPTAWTVRPVAADRAALEVPGERGGSITTALRQEGIDVTVKAGALAETAYFYFGYDVQ